MRARHHARVRSQREEPDDLEVLRLFVNTLDVEGGKDEIGTADGLGGWLVEHGLLARGEGGAPPPVSEEEVRRALELRESADAT